MQQAQMILAVAECITSSREVSWIMFSDGTPTQTWLRAQLEAQ